MKDIDKYLNSIAENSNTYNFIKQEIGENSFISMITGEERENGSNAITTKDKNSMVFQKQKTF